MDVTGPKFRVNPTADTGNRQPSAGKPAPEGGKSAPPPPPEPVDIKRAVAQIQSFLQDSKRQLRFQFHEGSGRTIITVVNPESGEVIRQIPPEEVMDLANALPGSGFHVISQKA